MILDIHERDIDSRLCQSCAACCRITFRLRDTTSRYRRFLRKIGYNVLPAATAGQSDCCNKKHDSTVDMGYCKHLVIQENTGGNIFHCRIYGTGDLPDLCTQFNCVSWAKANDNYTGENSLLVAAQQALNRKRAQPT